MGQGRTFGSDDGKLSSPLLRRHFPKFSDRDDSAFPLLPERKGRGKASIRNQSLGGAEHAHSVSDRREISPSREPLLRNQGCRARVPRRKVLRMTKPLCQFVERLWNRCSPTPRHESVIPRNLPLSYRCAQQADRSPSSG